MFPLDGAKHSSVLAKTPNVSLLTARYFKSVAPAALVGYFLGVAGILGQQVQRCAMSSDVAVVLASSWMFMPALRLWRRRSD